jgi:hypothetical protein
MAEKESKTKLKTYIEFLKIELKVSNINKKEYDKLEILLFTNFELASKLINDLRDRRLWK